MLSICDETLAAIRINEIADKGSENVCEGKDWIELFNDSTDAVALEGYILHDDNYKEDEGGEEFTFCAGASLSGGEYLVLCCNGDGTELNPKFKVGKSDTVTLLDSSGNAVSTSRKLPGLGEVNVTYALNALGEYVQTWTPTPGELNVITSKPLKDLRAQNSEGSSFFGMDEKGLPVSGCDAVVDLHAEIDADDWASLRSNPYTETYIDVKTFKVKSSTIGEHTLPSPGRMRMRGQSTLFYPICMGSEAVPFKLDFASKNSSQTLYGVESAYLRTHLSDESKMHEWVIHRMLANFGVPHARTRHVRFHVNDDLLGFYTFMEAIDQEYVSARSFGFDSFDQQNNALYKVKTMSLGCGNEEEYQKDKVEGFPGKCTSPDGAGGFDCCADDSWGEPKACAPGYTVKEQPTRNDWNLNCWYTCLSNSGEETSGGPYQFERGGHREKVIPRYDKGWCWQDFFGRIEEEKLSVVQAFYDKGYNTADDCGAFLLSQGLIDRDLGTNEWDSSMEEFINLHLSVKGACQNNQCSNKRQISDLIDIDNWLKNFAVYASIIGQDSPMGNGNNYFLAAHAGDGGTLNTPKWKMIPYDHNMLASSLCDAQCRHKDLTERSVIRPTCKHLSENPLVGPLLLNESLHERYLVFVKQFLEKTFSNSSFLEHMKLHSDEIEAIANGSPDSVIYGNIENNAIWNWISTRGEKILWQLAQWHEKRDKSAFPIDSSLPCVTTDEEFCSSTFCTSSDGGSGYDCWAGTSTQSCTCSKGTAKETGESFEYRGQTLYLYTCCTDGSGTGEQCGDYRGENIDAYVPHENCYKAVHGKGCNSYIHMDDYYSYGIQGGSTTLEECAAAVKDLNGRYGCIGSHFFFEYAGYCNCPKDHCALTAENMNAGSSGQLYSVTDECEQIDHQLTEAYSLVGSGWCLTKFGQSVRPPVAIWRNRLEFEQYDCKDPAKRILECLEDLCNEFSDCIAIEWNNNENVHLRFRSEESLIKVCGDSPNEVYVCRNWRVGWQVWRGGEACRNNCDVASTGGEWGGRPASGECFVKNDENLVTEMSGSSAVLPSSGITSNGLFGLNFAVVVAFMLV
jgi:hypothetical protein